MLPTGMPIATFKTPLDVDTPAKGDVTSLYAVKAAEEITRLFESAYNSPFTLNIFIVNQRN